MQAQIPEASPRPQLPREFREQEEQFERLREKAMLVQSALRAFRDLAREGFRKN